MLRYGFIYGIRASPRRVIIVNLLEISLEMEYTCFAFIYLFILTISLCSLILAI